QLPYTPQHTGNMAITLNTPWINIGYSLFGVGKRYYMSQNIPANEIKGYTEQTLSAGRSIRMQNVKLDIRGEIVNLGNVQYEVIRFYPMPGRSWRITLGMQY
ncbi:MAG: TonB-dependent receptor, partial [Muribaculaceae bacterium]|nr:TonB-dependent receptor [Muribaculaceae bacterium]